MQDVVREERGSKFIKCAVFVRLGSKHAAPVILALAGRCAVGQGQGSPRLSIDES